MQISMTWLHDYLDFTESAKELAEKYTMAGVPVENVKEQGQGLENVVVGRIAHLEPNPNSDHLLVCQLDVGGERLIQIQTGASNVFAGAKVPVALPGAHLPNGMHIKKGKMRGLASDGMLCSASELGLSLEGLPEEQQHGIYILPEHAVVGQNAKEALKLDRAILEFELTANRADCFSAWGLAREASILTGNPLHLPTIEVKEEAEDELAKLLHVRIEDELCTRFSARILREVHIGPSPAWMQQRLEDAGIRSINNIVDVTNFVMVELGQPMHAYDYDTLAGHTLIARKAQAGEKLTTLDKVDRELKGTELVIADTEKAAGLAGVMGGLATEVTKQTRTVVLEAAVFNGANVRHTSRTLGLRSEASGRFERGIDVTGTIRALNRAAQLLVDMGAAKAVAGIVDVYPQPQPTREISFTVQEINHRLGTTISAEEMRRILEALGFEITTQDTQADIVKVPSWRNDVSGMEDISEEIARIYGFDKIPSTLPWGKALEGAQSPDLHLVDALRTILCGLGMTETRSFSFMQPATLDKMRVPEDSPLRHAVPILNPLTDEYPLVRTNLLVSVLENAARNFSRKNEDLRLFEIAPAFFPKALPITEQPVERLELVGFLSGRRAPASWAWGNEEVDFFDMKGIVESLFQKLHIDRWEEIPCEHFALHPGKTLCMKKGKEVLATIGELHPAVAEAMDIHKRAQVFLIDVPTLAKYVAKHIKSAPLPKYPAMERDIAVLVDRDTPAADLYHTIAKRAGKIFAGANLFDVYEGRQAGIGKKSLAFRILFQSQERTLTDDEADKAVQNILQALEETFDAKLRT